MFLAIVLKFHLPFFHCGVYCFVNSCGHLFHTSCIGYDGDDLTGIGASCSICDKTSSTMARSKRHMFHQVGLSCSVQFTKNAYMPTYVCCVLIVVPPPPICWYALSAVMHRFHLYTNVCVCVGGGGGGGEGECACSALPCTAHSVVTVFNLMTNVLQAQRSDPVKKVVSINLSFLFVMRLLYFRRRLSVV